MLISLIMMAHHRQSRSMWYGMAVLTKLVGSVALTLARLSWIEMLRKVVTMH